MKILNLYAGIGGNRKLWGESHEITAVENNPEIAAIYKSLFPNDNVIIDDAHQYLLDHYKEYEFIWSSPPCPTHSRLNTDGQRDMRYPDMTLYQQIIALNNNWFKGKYVVENVIPYYKPLISPSAVINRHLFWANFTIPNINIINNEVTLAKQSANICRYGFSLKGMKINCSKKQILRNLVDPEVGLYIINIAQNIIVRTNNKQYQMEFLYD